MFSAKTKHGTHLTLYPFHDSGVIAPPPYYCSTCGEEVVLKKGKIRRWHFAHRHSSLCRGAPESEEHLEGKAVLLDWLENLGAVPRLEVFLPSLGRRADVLFTWRRETYALEYQCSSITPEEALQRTHDYLSCGITPIWIYSSGLLRSTSVQTYSIHTFEWTGLRADSSGCGTAITYFSPEKHRFYFLYPRASLSSQVTFGDLYTVELSEMSPAGLVHLPPVIPGEKTWMRMWLRTKKQWRYSRSRWQLHSDTRYVRVLFAQRRSDIPYFPSEAGWPVDGMTCFNTLPHHWQSMVLLSFLDPLPVNTSFSLQTAVETFRPAAEDILRLKPFPLVPNSIEHALEQYFVLLEKTGIIQKSGDGWKKERDVYLPGSIDEGYKMDQYYFARLFTTSLK
ncbi:competence protein CoiA [Salibacterium halotolerans]|uniref:Competence protein CoiA-like family, contains a predicted nuclease domain n=1 Tax=Salibacterium halotolerans TaxID=1884432 RepID=A0A1I5TA77_9BACI|nr:competence protein CoiA family protein [Salibacterium halotolerans]SFP79940.1 Competence protein CoiA-like family, contains a predicted nuclease domain [Salibacterium halotolerans]